MYIIYKILVMNHYFKKLSFSNVQNLLTQLYYKYHDYESIVSFKVVDNQILKFNGAPEDFPNIGTMRRVRFIISEFLYFLFY